MDPPRNISVHVSRKKNDSPYWTPEKDKDLHDMKIALENSDEFKRRVFEELYPDGDYRLVENITLTREILVDNGAPERMEEGVHRGIAYHVNRGRDFPKTVFVADYTYPLRHKLVGVYYEFVLEFPYTLQNTSMIDVIFTNIFSTEATTQVTRTLTEHYCALHYSNIKFSPTPTSKKWGQETHICDSKWAAKQARALIDLILKHNKKPL